MWKKEINMVEKYNEENPDNKVEMIIDPFKNEFWFRDKYGEKLSSIGEKKIWDYYGE